MKTAKLAAKGKPLVKSQPIVPVSLPRNYRWVRLDQIHQSPWNPPGRSTGRSFQRLIDSLSTRGQKEPIRLTKNFQIIDGHTRVAAARQLGWPSIEALVETKPMTVNEIKVLYMILNTVRLHLGPRDWLFVYLFAGPGCCPGRVITACTALETLLGHEKLVEFAQLRVSYSCWRTAQSVARYLDISQDNKTKLKQIVLWVVEQRQGFAARAWSQGEQDKGILTKAIEHGIPLSAAVSIP